MNYLRINRVNWFFRNVDYLILFAICLAIRIYHINTIDLWDDEFIGFFKWNLSTILQFPFSIRKTPVYIINNVLYKSLLPTSWLYLYNYIPRIPALIFGILTVIVLYDAFKRYIGKVAGFIIGCLSCTSYPLIIYAKESRVYSMTHFFLALYIWFYLSILNEIKTWKIVLFTISSILGFFTYPYLTFVTVIFYFCLSIKLVSTQNKKYYRPFFRSSIIYALFCIIFLLLMKSSFSSSYYSRFTSPIEPSFSFIFYAIKGMLSYYSSNSYFLVIVGFIFPVINLLCVLLKRHKMNYMYLLWICSSTLILGHILILFYTVNIFNPRHVGFLAVTFLASVSYGFYEIYNYIMKFSYNNKHPNIITTIFVVGVIAFSFTTRDFKYYIKTGINYHAGYNNYTENINFIINTLNEIGKNDSILLYCYRDDRNYYFYHYRTGKRVIQIEDLQSVINLSRNDNHKAKYIGFLDIHNANFGNMPISTMRKFTIYKNNQITLFISNNKIQQSDIDAFINKNISSICRKN